MLHYAVHIWASRSKIYKGTPCGRNIWTAGCSSVSLYRSLVLFILLPSYYSHLYIQYMQGQGMCVHPSLFLVTDSPSWHIRFCAAVLSIPRVDERWEYTTACPCVYNSIFLKWCSNMSHVGMVTLLIFWRNAWILLTQFTDLYILSITLRSFSVC